MMNKKQIQKRGTLLLMALLVASVTLAVGLGVYARTYKEILFSSYWKQTQVAFAAAAGGLECSMYWLRHPGAGGSNIAYCFGNNITGWDPLIQTGGFTVDIVTGTGPCVSVLVAWDGTLLATTTTARGYNVDCAAVTAGTDPRMVERGLRASI